MIHRYSNESVTRWDKGELKVQINVPGNPRPMGFCDGTAEDLAELQAIAEGEGAIADIQRKVLKTGREHWTLGNSEAQPEGED